MSDSSCKVQIIDTYAEAFGMWCCRLIVTASDSYWVKMAVHTATGYGTSIIGCDCEAGVEQYLTPDLTPDGRPGAALLFFAIKSDALAAAVVNRAGQCLMTTPTSAVFDGLPDINEDATAQTRRVALGDCISYFGDGFETQTEHAKRDCWAIPVMDGIFHIQADMGMLKGVGGGNLLLCGHNQRITLNAAKAAVDAVRPMPGVIMPFPGGVVRCGSKVGSRSNPQMIASTHHAYCPTLAHEPDSLLPAQTAAVYELIFDGIDLSSVKAAMQQAILTASKHDLLAITAGNYNSKLGKYFIHLHALSLDVS
ncbi:MAG: formylmethanofuran--tetrahydromethanopterin N-formyltransferase [Phycisphaeraceae bacterium]|nr:formylmethanofuran--tetrahydromethanopterin N-formyltransferase [Phycisphaeraceae bacterium]